MRRPFQSGAAHAPQLLAPLLAGCPDLSRYATDSNRQYVGCVVPASFVLAGVPPATQLCLTLDTNHLQDSPGAVTTTDGLFQSTPLRPIPQIWSDPLSSLTFGEGRAKNLIYAATPASDAGALDVTVVVSLLSGGGVEVRLLRGAPPLGDAGQGAGPPPIFAVFPLKLEPGACASLRAQNCAADAQ